MEDLKKDRDWTKKDLLEFIVTEMNLVTATGTKMTRRSAWYRELAEKGRRGIIDTVARDYPDEFVEGLWVEDSED